jgi:hypothetical protein
VLSGIRLSDWIGLLREERRQIDLSRLPRVFSITLQSLKNSVVGRLERRRFATALEEVVVQPPIFILGHWRSGTTHLHQLLCQDERFAFPNSYQTAFPHIFLSWESVESRLLGPFLPKCRPMDNMELSLASPQEDEFALCGSSLCSSCLQWVFPRQKEKFRKFLTFRGVNAEDVARWQEAFLMFIRKVQWRNEGRPLLLKSPQHTARIALLLQLFPQAKFVHIHRDPFRVFQSSRQLFRIMFDWHALQRPNLETLDDWVIEQYREMYEAFFEQQPLIPDRRFHEVGFEQLERDPVGEVRKLYTALNLPEFSKVEPKLSQYVDSVASYRKNQFSELPIELKERLGREWSVCFEKWGYSNSVALT